MGVTPNSDQIFASAAARRGGGRRENLIRIRGYPHFFDLLVTVTPSFFTENVKISAKTPRTEPKNGKSEKKWKKKSYFLSSNIWYGWGRNSQFDTVGGDFKFYSVRLGEIVNPSDTVGGGGQIPPIRLGEIPNYSRTVGGDLKSLRYGWGREKIPPIRLGEKEKSLWYGWGRGKIPPVRLGGFHNSLRYGWGSFFCQK